MVFGKPLTILNSENFQNVSFLLFRSQFVASLTNLLSSRPYVYVLIYIDTYMCVYTYIYIYKIFTKDMSIHTHICAHTCLRICINTYTYGRGEHSRVYTRYSCSMHRRHAITYMIANENIYVHIHVFVHVSIPIHMDATRIVVYTHDTSRMYTRMYAVCIDDTPLHT